MASAEERRREAEGVEVVYQTKVVQFLGRSTPIILQNDNGPCPLIAICNVLLLRNSLELSVDASEVSQAKLLDIVEWRMIESNSNLQDKDDGYISNRRQNMIDAISLLHNLTTGIDVNVHFRNINDFEFTPECAIFDLLDIGLYHGWIVDPQDTDTAQVIGSKSYDTLVAELVAFETRNLQEEDKRIPEGDCIDFAAATTDLSRGRSFDGPPVSAPLDQGGRRGDREELEEVMRVLNLSRTEVSSTVNVPLSHDDQSNSSPISREGTHIMGSGSLSHADSVAQKEESEKSHQLNLLVPTECNPSSDSQFDAIYPEGHGTWNDKTIVTAVENNSFVSEGFGDFLTSSYCTEKVGIDVSMQNQTPAVLSSELVESECYSYEDKIIVSGEGQSEAQSSSEDFTSQVYHKLMDNQREHDLTVFSCPVVPQADLYLSNGTNKLLDVSDEVNSSLARSEPIYGGKERILDFGLPRYEGQESVHVGEVVLSGQADKSDEDAAPLHSEDKVRQRQWQLMKNFLENNASQLTIYGLFCLQEGLKERELCVFFRNNHFSTMFKFNGELYLLVTDQGYMNQPNLVWEKLNEVNGDTVFMMGDFKEFKVDTEANDLWNEQNAMATTAEYPVALGSSVPATSTFNSDLQLAVALQQEEFKQQPQRQEQQSSQQAPVSGCPWLIMSPQVSSTSTASLKDDSKCTVM